MNEQILSCGHELGIHPNFLKGSSHGSEVSEIIENCLSFVPNAKIMRTHSLVRSSPLFAQIFSEFDQLKMDVSILMHRSEFVHSVVHESENFHYKQLFYNWGDGAEFFHKRYSDLSDLFFGDTTVYLFHPVHLYLNSSDGLEYHALKEKYCKHQKLTALSRNEFDEFKNNALGVRNFLENVIAESPQDIELLEI